MASANSSSIDFRPDRDSGQPMLAMDSMAIGSQITRATLVVLLIVLNAVALPVSTAQDPGAVSMLDAPYSRKGADSCLACHRDSVTLAVFRGPHGSPQHPGSPFGAGQLQCEACHGPGGDHAGRVRRGEQRPALVAFSDEGASAALQNEMCLTCHDDEQGVSWRADAHAGHDGTCADCHTSHAPRDAVLTVTTQTQVCQSCHTEQRNAGLKPFTHPLDEGKMNCGACHSIHDAGGEALLVRATLNQTCYQCHADKRGPFLWEHAPVAEDCSVCHDAHGSNHPGLLTQRGPFLCQGCHAEAGHPSLVNDMGGLAAARPSQYLLGKNCMNCHSLVHGSNHPSGSRLMR